MEDLTPNPKKLLQIGNELRKLNKVISDLTPVSELPLTARPRSRKEKNKLASRYMAAMPTHVVKELRLDFSELSYRRCLRPVFQKYPFINRTLRVL